MSQYGCHEKLGKGMSNQIAARKIFGKVTNFGGVYFKNVFNV